MNINISLSRFVFSLMLSVFIASGCAEEEVKEGCTIACADNYDPSAEIDNRTCTGCRDVLAANYCPGVVINNNNCTYDCELNQTGEIYFINKSNTNSTYDIIWDGAKLTTLAPGETSATYTVTANITHTLLFQYTNTSNLACTASTPVIPQCQSVWYSCTG